MTPFSRLYDLLYCISFIICRITFIVKMQLFVVSWKLHSDIVFLLFMKIKFMIALEIGS